MPDGRKNNRGKIGNKGGRPAKADEIRKIELMDSVLAPVEAWAALCSKVREGDVTAIKAWIEHRFGKPTETKDLNLNTETIKNIIIENV
jgi:hypothetical protein